MPNTRKMKWGVFLIAGLALAASLIVAPLGAYAADVPTPELKDTHEFDNLAYWDHSPSGRYVLCFDSSTYKMNLLDTTDWSLTAVEIDSSGPDWHSAYCFSVDEKTFYCFNRKNKSVVVYDLSNDKSKEYPLGSAVPSEALDRCSVEIKLQISKDNKTLYITSVIEEDPYSNRYDGYVLFSIVDFKNGNISTKYEYSAPSDDYTLVGPAWISNDGKYGYVMRVYSGEETENDQSGVRHDVATIDLNAKKVINTSEIDDSSVTPNATSNTYKVVVNDDGATIDWACYVSKEGDVASYAQNCLQAKPFNQDGSLAFGGRYVDCDGHYADSDGYANYSDLGSVELSVIDTKSGETKWETNCSLDLLALRSLFAVEEKLCPVSLSSDGAYLLACGPDDNSNYLMYLTDTKTGAYSQVTLKGCLEHGGFDDCDYSRSVWFSKDDSLIYFVQYEDEDFGFSVDVYKSGFSNAPTLSGPQEEGAGSLPSNLIFIVAITVIFLAAGVGGFVVICMRKHSKGYAATANGTISAAPQQTVPQNFVGQQTQAQLQQAPMPLEAPRFCGSCGGPLVPGTRFCPHCGAPVKH